MDFPYHLCSFLLQMSLAKLTTMALQPSLEETWPCRSCKNIIDRSNCDFFFDSYKNNPIERTF